MRKINLLPWRETRRKEKQQQFITALGIAFAIVITIFSGLHGYLAHQKNNQMQCNALLQNEITRQNQARLSLKIIEEKTQSVMRKIHITEALQRSRTHTSQLLDEITSAMPSRIALTKITRTDQQITLEGNALSKAELSDFMHTIHAHSPLQSPILDVMKTQDKAGIEKKENTDKIQIFTLHFQKYTAN